MNPLSPKQKDCLNNSTSKINILEGSVRAGKTYASLWAFLKFLTYGPQGEYAIITRTYDSFKRNILPQLERIVGVDAKYYKGNREMHLWGKTIHIIGADDERAEAKIRGPTFSGAYVDELTIIPETVFKMLISRCAMGGARIFATTNPDSPFHWVKRDYLDNNPDVKSWQFTLDDNPELLEEDKAYLKRQYRGLWYQRFIEGKWVQAEGSIYDFFETTGLYSHVIEFPLCEAREYIVGIDYGTTNPCAFVLIGINKSKPQPNMWVEDEYYYASKIHQRQKTDAEYCADLINFLKFRNVSAIYLDPSAASFRAELLKCGVNGVYDAENEVIDGIRLVSNMLSQGAIKITRKCSKLIEEFQSYVWDPKSAITGLDKPLKQNDHALDALRYALYTHFFNKSGQRLTPNDLDRMQREAYGQQGNLPDFFQDPLI